MNNRKITHLAKFRKTPSTLELANHLYRCFCLRLNGLEKARGLTGAERKELSRLKEVEWYLRGYREDFKQEHKSLKDRVEKVVYLDRRGI